MGLWPPRRRHRRQGDRPVVGFYLYEDDYGTVTAKNSTFSNLHENSTSSYGFDTYYAYDDNNYGYQNHSTLKGFPSFVLLESRDVERSAADHATGSAREVRSVPQLENRGLLYVVGLTVDPAHETEFNRYYHNDHAPAALEAVPELLSVRRYEQFGVDGSLRWYSRVFLTIYEASPDADAERWSAEGVLPPEHPAMASWGSWRERCMNDVTRHVYREVFRHPRVTWDGPFGGRPMFVVTVEMARHQEDEFRDWYHNEYLPQNLAEVPTWAACRRYEAVAGDPRRSMVVYEAWDEAGLARSLASMRSAARLEENMEWHRWEPGIVSQDAAMFRPILRIP